ncbi:unnamed protein product [Heligmosomoides polygyrus]|uniref:GIY-YIG domain-containing protein n=1 Tax=Heligmosomoides polygyrus TaxID=6339 RepID=A0A183F9M7_HELPZ|nr:unnamed protein product [Heligmosomoides polygyrus]
MLNRKPSEGIWQITLQEPTVIPWKRSTEDEGGELWCQQHKLKKKERYPSASLFYQTKPVRLFAHAFAKQVYRTCQCGDEYIGETGRPPCTRVEKHLDGLRRSNVSTPLREHRVRSHNGGMVDVAVTILARERDVTVRRTLEAFWIAARNPKINRKEKCIAVTQELPYVDLCGFDLRGRAQGCPWGR